MFGSNTAGIHGAGAALDALRHFGAIKGLGEGLQGQSYALPTKGLVAGRLRTLPIEAIAEHASRFKTFAASRPDLTFILTPVGCGLAGYRPDEIAPLFVGAPPNVVMPTEFTKASCP